MILPMGRRFLRAKVEPPFLDLVYRTGQTLRFRILPIFQGSQPKEDDLLLAQVVAVSEVLEESVGRCRKGRDNKIRPIDHFRALMAVDLAHEWGSPQMCRGHEHGFSTLTQGTWTCKLIFLVTRMSH
jgi:hypothetical protein